MNRISYAPGALSLAALVLAACGHEAVPDQISADVPAAEAAELPSVFVAMNAIFQPHFQGVADTAFNVYDDEGNLDASLLSEEEWATMKASAEVLRDTARQFAAADDIRVADEGQELLNEGQGFIPSDAVQALIDGDRDGFQAKMMRLSGEADKAIEAIDTRDAAALSLSSDTLYAACKTCHVTYWYPGKR
jgi:cytochrome c556